MDWALQFEMQTLKLLEDKEEYLNGLRRKKIFRDDMKKIAIRETIDKFEYNKF